MQKLDTIDGWEILITTEGKFLGNKEGQNQIQEMTLAEVKTEIDRLRKISTKKLPYWKMPEGKGEDKRIVEANVTSMKGSNRGYGRSFTAWGSIKQADGTYSRGNMYYWNDLITPTEENREILNKWMELDKQVDVLVIQKYKLAKQLTKYTKKEVAKNFGYDIDDNED